MPDRVSLDLNLPPNKLIPLNEASQSTPNSDPSVSITSSIFALMSICFFASFLETIYKGRYFLHV